MTHIPAEYILAAIPLIACLFFAFHTLKMAVTAKPCFLSSRRHFSFIAIPVMGMVGVSLYKITVIPDFMTSTTFFGGMAAFFAACYAVILKRGDWYYVFGAGKKELFSAIRRGLKARDIDFEENKAPEGEGTENITEFTLEGRASRLRVSVFSGQDMAQVGAVPSDNALLSGIVNDMKKQPSTLGGTRSIPGFLLTGCILMGFACYWTFDHVHSMDEAWMIEKGWQYLETHRHGAAIATYTKALKLNPESVEALRWRGRALEESGKALPALNDWEKALDLDPGNSDIMAHMARLFLSHGEVRDEKKALEWIAQAAANDPESVYILDTQAWILAQTGNYQEAAQIQEKVVKILTEKKATRALMKEVNAKLEAYKAGKPAPEE